MPNEIILLSRSDIESLMPIGEYVDAVAEAFRLHAEGRAVSPAPLHIPAEGGGFHVKSASLPLGRRYGRLRPTRISRRTAACEICPPSRAQSCSSMWTTERRWLSSIPWKSLSSGPVPPRPSPAATLRVPNLAPRRFAGAASRAAFSSLRSATSSTSGGSFAWDKDASAAAGFAAAMAEQHGLDMETPPNLRAATLESDVIVTCTPSREPYLGA
jgi:hypothetical protein